MYTVTCSAVNISNQSKPCCVCYSTTQAYQRYQEVKYVNTMVEDFGVDDELRSNEELYSGTFAQLMSISCSVKADEEQTESASLFEAACAEKIQQFDDSESDEEVCVCVCLRAGEEGEGVL